MPTVALTAVKAPDEKYKRYKKVWFACEEAGVDIPEEVLDFFEGMVPDERGVVIENCSHFTKEWEEHKWTGGKIIDLAKVPDDITHLRIYAFD